MATAATAQEALDALAVRPPDAAILDLILPDGNGVDICRSIREWSEMPVIVLSAVGEEAEKVRALEAGRGRLRDEAVRADELIARLRAALRRARPRVQDEPVLRADGLELDLAAHRVCGGRGRGAPHPHRVRAAARAHAAARPAADPPLPARRGLGSGYEDDTQVLRVHVANLRRKIEAEPAAPRYVLTDPGVGYRFAG